MASGPLKVRLQLLTRRVRRCRVRRHAGRTFRSELGWHWLGEPDFSRYYAAQTIDGEQVTPWRNGAGMVCAAIELGFKTSKLPLLLGRVQAPDHQAAWDPEPFCMTLISAGMVWPCCPRQLSHHPLAAQGAAAPVSRPRTPKNPLVTIATSFGAPR